MYNPNMGVLALSIGNAYEFHHRGFSQPERKSRLPERKQTYAASAEMSIFWGGNNLLVLTPLPVDSLFLRDLQDILSINIVNVNPSHPTGFISSDMIDNIERLITLLNPGSPFIVLPYGVTNDFYRLLDQLRLYGLEPYKRTFPQIDDSWTIDYIDSKIGGRSLLSDVALNLDFMSVPFGITGSDRQTVISIAKSMMKRNYNFVVKANYGHGGRQVFSFHSPLRSEQLNVLENLFEALTDDPYMDFPPFIVEEFVLSEGAYPVNVNGQISEEGLVSFEGVAKLVTTSSMQYVGCQIGRDLLSENETECLKTICVEVGSRMARLGYVGWYDIDLIFDPSRNRFYGLEINPRATGVTYVIGIAKQLYGDDWAKHGALFSIDRFYFNASKVKYETIHPVIVSTNQKYSVLNAGVIPVVTQALTVDSPYIGFVTFAPEAAVAKEVTESFEKALLIIP